MRIELPLLVILVALSPTLLSQVTISGDVGIAYAFFNDRPDIPEASFDQTDPNIDREFLRAVGNEAYALNFQYRLPEKPVSFGLRLQYLGRGYQHVYERRMENAKVYTDNFNSEISFLDFQPRIIYSLNDRLSVNGGPYASVSIAESRNPLRPEGEFNLQREDFGGHFGMQFRFNRFYVHGHAQISLRDFSLNSFGDFTMVDPPAESSPVSSFIVGVGYDLIKF